MKDRQFGCAKDGDTRGFGQALDLDKIVLGDAQVVQDSFPEHRKAHRMWVPTQEIYAHLDDPRIDERADRRHLHKKIAFGQEFNLQNSPNASLPASDAFAQIRLILLRMCA